MNTHTVVTLTLVIILIYTVGTADAQSPPIIGVDALASSEQGVKRCLLGVSNRSSQTTALSVHVALLFEGRSRFDVGPVDLAPAQSVILTHDIKPSVTCTGPSAVYRIEFDQLGRHNALLSSSVPTVGQVPASAWNINQLIGPIFGLLSGLVGGWVAHYWTLALERSKDRLTATREREKERITWRTEVFKTVEPAFRDFLLKWNKSLDAQMLHAQFEQLRRSVITDPIIVNSYRETYKILADANASADRRQLAAEDLEKTISAFVHGLDPYS